LSFTHDFSKDNDWLLNRLWLAGSFLVHVGNTPGAPVQAATKN